MDPLSMSIGYIVGQNQNSIPFCVAVTIGTAIVGIACIYLWWKGKL